MEIYNRFKDLFKLRKELNTCKNQVERIESNINKLFQFQNYEMINKGKPTRLNNFELKIFSQNGEDGIILEILKRFENIQGRIVEIGIEDGTECNSANLLINFGWKGLLIEGDEDYAKKANSYYCEKLKLKESVDIKCKFISTRNFSEVLRKSNYHEGIDILSIDVDGVDYWLWESLDSQIRPKLLIIEYNAYLPYDKAITVPDDEGFERYKKHQSGYYFGASLKALEKLGKEKGYSLVGCDSRGVNSFFVADEFLGNRFEVLAAHEAYFPLTSGTKIRPKPEEAFSIVKEMPFVEV
jgi:hypothetical protein